MIDVSMMTVESVDIKRYLLKYNLNIMKYICTETKLQHDFMMNDGVET